MGFRFDLLLFALVVLATPVLSDLVLSKVDRRVSFSYRFMLVDLILILNCYLALIFISLCVNLSH